MGIHKFEVDENIDIFDNIDMAFVSRYRYRALDTSISISEKKPQNRRNFHFISVILRFFLFFVVIVLKKWNRTLKKGHTNSENDCP